MASKCTICNETVAGYATDDLVCLPCFQANLAGDLLRRPPQPWWMRDRLPLAPRQDGVRHLRRLTAFELEIRTLGREEGGHA